MEARIANLEEKKLVGKYCKMSSQRNRTKELWQSFMPVRGQINNRVGRDFYSAEVYGPKFFVNFDPAEEFEKWAAVEVTNFKTVPYGMETIIFPAGLYAVFLHKGTALTAPKTYRYIYTEWIPKSEFLLDDRPHFAVMGEGYNPDSHDSKEEIWIPIKKIN